MLIEDGNGFGNLGLDFYLFSFLFISLFKYVGWRLVGRLVYSGKSMYFD